MIPVENIYKMDVLKGGSLLLLGNGAFGGVINIITKKNVKPGILVKAKLGSFNNYHYIANFNIPVFNKLFINYFGQYNSMKPEIEYFPGERFTSKSKNSYLKSRKQNHGLSLDYFLKSGQISAKFYMYHFSSEKPSWANSRNNYLSAITYKGLSDLNIFISNIVSKDKIKRNTLETTQYVSEYQTQRLNFKISKKFNTPYGRFQFLSDYYHDELDDISTLKDHQNSMIYYDASLYDNRGSLAGIYSFDNKLDSLGNKSWRTFLAFRGDATASGHNDITYNWGTQAVITADKWNIKPYINYGKNVNYPTLLETALTEDFMSFKNSDTIYSALKPEYNYAYELGSEFIYESELRYIKKIHFDIAWFSNTIYNKILKRPMGDMVFQAQTGSNLTSGFETSVEFKDVFNCLLISSSYTKLNIGNHLYYDYQPESICNLQIDYFTLAGLTLMFSFFYEGKSYAWFYDYQNELQTAKLASTYDMDFSLSYKLNIKNLNFSWQLSCFNVFDNGGYSYYYLRKRSLQASISIRY